MLILLIPYGLVTDMLISTSMSSIADHQGKDYRSSMIGNEEGDGDD